MCVKVASAQASTERGQAARWTVTAWATGGNVSDATVRLQAAPTAAGTPAFSTGCGSDDGTPACDLGTVAAQSAKRRFQAQLTVPATASAVKSVTLTVVGSAAHLPKASQASAAVTITAPPAPTAAPPGPLTVTSPLAVGALPGIPAAAPSLSPGGNAAGLFPTLNPSPARRSGGRSAGASPAANTSALPEGASVVGAQLAGLAALALGCVLAVARMSVRRRPGRARPPGAQAAPPPQRTPPDAQAQPKEGPATQPEAQPDPRTEDGR